MDGNGVVQLAEYCASRDRHYAHRNGKHAPWDIEILGTATNRDTGETVTTRMRWELYSDDSVCITVMRGEGDLMRVCRRPDKRALSREMFEFLFGKVGAFVLCLGAALPL